MNSLGSVGGYEGRQGEKEKGGGLTHWTFFPARRYVYVSDTARTRAGRTVAAPVPCLRESMACGSGVRRRECVMDMVARVRVRVRERWSVSRWKQGRKGDPRYFGVKHAPAPRSPAPWSVT